MAKETLVSLRSMSPVRARKYGIFDTLRGVDFK
jgi:hypothetical protein